MKADVSTKIASMSILLAILIASMSSTGFGSQSYEYVIKDSAGSIVYGPQVYVNVNFSEVIDQNKLSLGFCLAHDWRIWRDRAVFRQLAEDANFEMVRFFSHLVEPCTRWYEASETGSFNWGNVDSLVQRIFEVGAEPLITIGYCDYNGIIIPDGMAINPSTGLPYPESYAAYCREWVRHFEAVGLPVRYYEIFNEAWFYFYPSWNWNEVKAGYFLQLFNTCYNAMHNENPGIYVGNDASLRRRFLDYWITHGGNLDFLSFHKYDCDGTSMGDATPLQRAEERCFQTDSLRYGVNHARQLWYNARGVILAAINSETNWSAVTSPGTDPRIQQVVGTVWLALSLRQSILEGVQYNVYHRFSSSKSWEQKNKPSGGFGLGMINQDDNQPWYPYYLQEMVGVNLFVGDSIVDSGSSSDDVRSLAWIHEGTANILLVCKVDETRTIHLQGLTAQLNLSKIDNNVSYVTPRVQTGRIDSSDLLIADGYAVILLQTFM